MIRMNQPIDEDGTVHFTTTLFALIREVDIIITIYKYVNKWNYYKYDQCYPPQNLSIKMRSAGEIKSINKIII